MKDKVALFAVVSVFIYLSKTNECKPLASSTLLRFDPQNQTLNVHSSCLVCTLIARINMIAYSWKLSCCRNIYAYVIYSTNLPLRPPSTPAHPLTCTESSHWAVRKSFIGFYQSFWGDTVAPN